MSAVTEAAEAIKAWDRAHQIGPTEPGMDQPRYRHDRIVGVRHEGQS